MMKCGEQITVAYNVNMMTVTGGVVQRVNSVTVLLHMRDV